MHINSKEAWQGIANCSQCTMRHSVLFSGLVEEDFKALHKPVHQYQLKAGDKIYGRGDPTEYMYTIRSGLIKLVNYLPDGTMRIVRLLRTSDVIGLEAILDPSYKHDAVALHPTEICRFPVSIVTELSKTNPKLHHELMTRWQRALNEADAWVTDFSTGNSKQRIARLILLLVKGNPANTCLLFGREDMGATLGITTETTSRIIAEFKRQHLIVEVSVGYYLCDVVKLKAMSNHN